MVELNLSPHLDISVLLYDYSQVLASAKTINVLEMAAGAVNKACEFPEEWRNAVWTKAGFLVWEISQ